MHDSLEAGRSEYREPVEHEGSRQAGDGGERRRLVGERLGEEWVELVLVPEREIHWVMKKEAEVETSA